MSLLWKIIKRTAMGIWEEIFYLVVFNLAVVAPALMGINLISYGWTSGITLFLPLGVLCLLAVPPALFGLFQATDQISKGNAIKISTFTEAIKTSLKPAYIWGGVNLVVGVILLANIAFYFQMTVAWAPTAGMFFVGLSIIWGVLQLLALSLYPRLVKPDFKLAQKNSMAMIGMKPGLMLGITAITLIFLVISAFIQLQLLFLLFVVSIVALLFSVTAHEILKSVETTGENPPPPADSYNSHRRY